MPGAARLGDKSLAPVDAHGCPGCPHPAVQGPAVAGSPNVLINNQPALRSGDTGVHAACCTANFWQAMVGSLTVLVNGQQAARMGDMTKHCGGPGVLVGGSVNVLVGG